MDLEYYKIMALDYGDVRIGVAVSDLTRTIANGLECINRTNINKDIDHILKLVSDNKVKIIVLGLPMNMDGTESNQTIKTKQFAELLKTKIQGVKIEFLDERLTSMQAEKLLISADVSRNKRKQVIDKMSATIILQDYLNSI